LRPSTIGLIAAAIATVVAGSACAIILSLFAPGISPLMILAEMSPVPKVVVIFIILNMIGVTLTGLIGLLVTRRSERGPGGPEILLWVATGVCTVFGVLAALYSELNTQIGIRAVGPVSFAVTAPSRAESLLALTVGLAGATLALAFMVGIVNRRMGPRAKP